MPTNLEKWGYFKFFGNSSFLFGRLSRSLKFQGYCTFQQGLKIDAEHEKG
jgi:hypothetical protein